ncbi:MAG: UDP-N-acetylglucosamine 1-carboxyvinyltransferase [Rhodobiaceae bacterium]|nr:UDP-N-acetylglucosamine 1-carboxyvinyltransferase [Rhodobiaceae bacterium]MBT5517348.1 UDP-N-acetylglucosamine 1-carboxyvinyltransferase [Rhodobiaceae bacterium]MBT7279182.1 UDP-N-acetylglucosamine 1-carboxyvinyltransferase [Rhodobiaceae bacterium]MDG2496126.1 UDP-N-acetylglucosamine 1-carboxyvinyltransferase [Alphaproteobacteria bacterium]
MDEIIIEGGVALTGEIAISGSKNAVLPLMVAGLLSAEKLILRGTPRLADTQTLARVLRELGAEVEEFGQGPGEGLSVHTKDLSCTRAPYELVSKMRASFWVLGPLLARAHEAQVSLPGGCAIGTRPVDLYLKGLEAMGAEIDVASGYVNATAKGGLKGARIDLPFVSVGATHVLMMAATLAKGTTLITNAATEPEVVDVGTCLMAMGANIEGLGTRNLTITGVDRLSGAEHSVSRDRIEAGAFALAIAATHGDARLTGIQEDVLGALAPAMRLAGCELHQEADAMRIIGPKGRAIATPVTTEPYPGFATDLQAPFMGLMCGADGVSRIRETIFENRFMHVQELVRLGADITLEGDTAIVTGVAQLQGAPVMATDLRASATLVIAGLMAKGQTRISRVYHLDRGYERIEEKLSAAGAHIWRERV